MLKDSYSADISASAGQSAGFSFISSLQEKLSYLKTFFAGKRWAMAVTAAAGALGGGLYSPIAEIRTVAFFLLIEFIVLGMAVGVSKVAKSYMQVNRAYLQRAFSNLILGLHLTAGFVVLGVYFTI